MMASAELSRRRVGFGGHQLAEYAIAAALVVVAMHLNGRPEIVLGLSGGVLAGHSLVTKGPLSAARLLSRRVHLYMDLPLAGAIALSPLLYLPNIEVIPIILSEAVAIVLVRMSLTTEIVARPRNKSTRAFPLRVGGSRAAGRSQAASSVATGAGRAVGVALAKTRDSRAPLDAARGLGRVAGRARWLGRAAAAGKLSPNPTDQTTKAPPRSTTVSRDEPSEPPR
jgi:hypothetical protein